MSDIKHISTQNEELLNSPSSKDNLQRVVGKMVSKQDPSDIAQKRGGDPKLPRDMDFDSPSPTRDKPTPVKPHVNNGNKQDLEHRKSATENPERDTQTELERIAQQHQEPDATQVPQEDQAPKVSKAQDAAEQQVLEEMQDPPKRANTIGGFGKDTPDGQQSINEPKKVVGEKNEVGNSESAKRAEAVKNAYLHAWNNYKKFAWGHDELKPLSHSHQDWLSMGLSLVDSIDTMYLMGLTAEYETARDWIANHLRFDAPRDVSFFETTIRVVGGLVSIYDLTGDRMFIEKAEQLAKRLMPAFNTPTGIPKTTINLQSGYAVNPAWAGGSSILSEAGTVQLEYATLSRHTNNQEYGQKALKVFDVLDKTPNKPSGLYSVYIDPNSGHFSRNHVTLGALGDSFYEYLLKMYLLTDKKEPKYQRMYESVADAIINRLVKKSSPSGLTYIAELIGGSINDKMDHLVCFAGAMFALGAYHNVTNKVEEHMQLGKEITRTCHETYVRQATGLGPELVNFVPGQDFHPGANHYILRPETVESYFVLYWITGDPIYQEWGWEAFQAIETYCRTPDGYSGVRDVTTPNVSHDDLQQSFFMAETLKYLYLLFAPRSTLSLDEYVFNTEAHPIKIWK
jgi:mannosyl-oligosaccharide alpha-1,2-mannosidase